MKIALVHDYLNQWGGAEEVLLALHELFPKAPIYTLFYDQNLGKGETEKVKNEFDQLLGPEEERRLLASGLQKLPTWLRNSRLLLPIYPTAVEMFDLTDYDLVISDSSAFSKGVITRPGAIHICYCHTPTRYLWDWHERYLQEQKFGWFRKGLIVPLLSYLRVWDRWAADRVDHFIANSDNVKERIRKYYGKDSEVIYPPIDVMQHKEDIEHISGKRTIKEVYDGADDDKNYYLLVARLSAYKRIDLAIDACNRLQIPLKIVGTGHESDSLRERAWSTVSFTGQVTRAELEELYRNCKVLIMPGLEDFGMVMVEALSFGKPVIAYRDGGALEIVQPGINGEFFEKENVRSLMDTIRAFEANWEEGAYLPQEVFETAKRFDKRFFKEKIADLLESVGYSEAIGVKS